MRRELEQEKINLPDKRTETFLFFCPARPENREKRVQSFAHCAGCASHASASCAISRPAVAQLK